MMQPLNTPRRSVRVLLKQGHVIRRIWHRLVQILLWTYPAIMMWIIRRPKKAALLYGKNDDEENLLASALALTRTYQGDIIYLASDTEQTKVYIRTLAPSIRGSQPERVQVRARTDQSILKLHVRCQLVITSHILISSPQARGKRVHVHVSHGLGPKTYRNIKSSETALVSNTTIWNDQHLRSMGKTTSTTILRGYPRQDFLIRGSHVSSFEKLNIDVGVPFVVWTPTVRSANFGARGRWTEGAELDTRNNQDTWELLPKLQAAAAEHGIKLVAKPHPIEAGAMRDMGLHVVTNEDIWSAGLSPYHFIGRSSGLISDYSSIWIDYFATNKPVGLFCPDLEQFQTGIRGLLDPPFENLASGLFITSTADAREFFSCVATGRTYNTQDYQRVRTHIGYFETPNERSGMLIDDIQRLGATEGADLAFSPVESRPGQSPSAGSWSKRLLFLLPLLVQALVTLGTIPIVIVSAGPEKWAAIALGQSVGGIGAVLVSLGWGVSGPMKLASLEIAEHAQLLRMSFLTRSLAGLPVALILTGVSVLITADHHLEAALGCLTTLLLAFNSTWYFLGKSDPVGLLKLDALPRIGLMAVGWGIVAAGADVVVGLTMQCLAPVLASVLVHRYRGTQSGFPTRSGWRGVVSEIFSQRHGMASQVIPASFNFSPLIAVTMLAPSYAPAFALVDKVQKQLVTGFIPFGNMLISKAAAQVTAREQSQVAIARTNAYWVIACGLATGVGTLVLGYPLIGLLSHGHISISVDTLAAMSGVVAFSFIAAVLPATSLADVKGLKGASQAAAWGALFGIAAIALLTNVLASFGAELGLLVGFLITACTQILLALKKRKS